MSAPRLRVLSFKGRPPRKESPAHPIEQALRLLIEVSPGSVHVLGDLILECLENYEPTRSRAWRREFDLLEHQRQMRRPALEQVRERDTAVVVWTEIQRLHAGPKRTFWCDVPRAAEWDIRLDPATVDEAQDLAAERLAVFLSDRGIEPAEAARPTLEACPQYNGRLFYKVAIQHGRYRILVNSLPDQVAAAWLEKGGEQ